MFHLLSKKLRTDLQSASSNTFVGMKDVSRYRLERKMFLDWFWTCSHSFHYILLNVAGLAGRFRTCSLTVEPQCYHLYFSIMNCTGSDWKLLRCAFTRLYCLLDLSTVSVIPLVSLFSPRTFSPNQTTTEHDLQPLLASSNSKWADMF